ncbi:MAG: hypothetical protein Q4F05_03985 [bacterium]|nr:hypothetical protein [bacterium]
MLGKLIKHEYRSTYKLFCAIYGTMAFITLFTIFTTNISLFDNMPFRPLRTISTIAFAIGCFALPIGSIIYIIYRFYKNLFTDEGYLTFTLPVSRMQIIGSKYLVSCSWFAGSLLLLVGSLYLYIKCNSKISNFVDALKMIMDEVLVNAFTDSSNVKIYLCIYAISYVLYVVAFFYLALAFGQLIVPNHKIVGALLAYLVLQLVEQLISLLVMGLFMVFTSYSLKSPTLPSTYYLVYGLILFVMTFVWLFFTNLICTKKLNLS